MSHRCVSTSEDDVARMHLQRRRAARKHTSGEACCQCLGHLKVDVCEASWRCGREETAHVRQEKWIPDTMASDHPPTPAPLVCSVTLLYFRAAFVRGRCSEMLARAAHRVRAWGGQPMAYRPRSASHVQESALSGVTRPQQTTRGYAAPAQSIDLARKAARTSTTYAESARPFQRHECPHMPVFD